MKTQLFSYLFVAFILTGLTSCKKNYTCKCNFSGGSVSGPTSASETYSNVTQDDAYNACEAEEENANNNPQVLETIGACSCELE